ncbi:hypothetical protein LO762_14620 [Actinocorallia sp. API 0066]|uniref:hypothetical protein n=1 Tax=Actinocorallia sp. API 0066 TaxID=2896846 RepID=UPI001E368AA3|nr:hypothetical protein [Actinocorallia sp. API 0066]MCD0450415.1 hypothetical protein [Actinocorallia sp. API 0066]
MRAFKRARLTLWGLLAVALITGAVLALGDEGMGPTRPVSAVAAVPAVPGPSPSPSASTEATPSAEPAATTPSDEDGEEPEEDCGFAEFDCHASSAINGWFTDLIKVGR